MPSEVLLLLVVVIAVALIFDFSNGFHDAANAIATSVSTQALSPRQAITLAALMNLAGALVSTEVAATIGKGIIDLSAVTLIMVVAGLAGAISWNVFTWYLGLPTSSSHALIGGLTGSAIIVGGLDAVLWPKLVAKAIVPTLVSPIAGVILGFLIMVGLYWLFRRAVPGPVNRLFRGLQTISASFMAFTHGTNDAQKTMGVIAMALVLSGAYQEFTVPLWVILSAGGAMAFGTLVGGWRIIRTMGTRIVKLQPINGFAAETTASSILFTNAYFGFPISTTHVITSSIVGVGATKRLSAVRWGVARSILLAWLVTLPGAASLGALFAFLVGGLG